MRARALFTFAVLLAACGGGEQKGARFPGAATATKRSTAQDREAVSITVYNQNFGLVREVRNVDIGRGKVSLEVRDVAATIQPTTVHIKSLENPATLSVLEQNYRFDLLSPQKLLEKYVDKKVKIIRYN